MFNDEDEMRDIIICWLKDNGLNAKKSIYVKTFEIDIAAVGRKKLGKGSFDPHKDSLTYAFEAKIATTKKLAKEVVEQAIIRLLAVDYVYIVVPRESEIWINSTKKGTTKPPEIIKRYISGSYSKKIGLISVTPSGEVNVVKVAQRSGLVINELRDLVINRLKINAFPGLRPNLNDNSINF